MTYETKDGFKIMVDKYGNVHFSYTKLFPDGRTAIHKVLSEDYVREAVLERIWRENGGWA